MERFDRQRSLLEQARNMGADVLLAFASRLARVGVNRIMGKILTQEIGV